jgi:hypothetical protein
LHFGTFDLKTHRGIIIETIKKLPSNQPIKKLAALSLSNPDITTPIRTIPTRIKNPHKIQLISNTPISKSNKVNKKIFSQHFIKALLSHSFGKFSRFFCVATF